MGGSPSGEADGRFYVLADDDRQYSLRPSSTEAPSGWLNVFGAEDRGGRRCLLQPPGLPPGREEPPATTPGTCDRPLLSDMRRNPPRTMAERILVAASEVWRTPRSRLRGTWYDAYSNPFTVDRSSARRSPGDGCTRAH